MSNFTAILQGDSSGLLVFKAFLLPILYVSTAFLAVTGEAILKRFCTRRKGNVASRKKVQPTSSREYSVDKTREEVLQEALKRGAQLEFFSTKRTFEHFCSMTKHNIVPAASRGQRTAYDAGRRVLYTTFRGTSFQTALRPAIVVTCLAGLWCWMILLFEELSVDSPMWLESFLQHCAVLSTLNDSLRTYVSFMFVFYAINSLQLWGKIFWICNEIDDRAVSIAMNASAMLHTNSLRDRQVRWKMYRYVTLAHFLVYGTISKSVAVKSAFFTSQFLAVGLLTEVEKVALDASPNPKTTLVLWMSQMFNHEEVAKDMPLNIRLKVISEIIKMKDEMADLQTCMESYPPLSWAQVMQFLIDVYLLFTPVAFVSKMYIDGTEVQIWPLVSTFLVTIFFQGLLGMINLIRNPFGDDVDDFNFDYSLLRAERECLSYLGYPALDPEKKKAEEERKRRARIKGAADNDEVSVTSEPSASGNTSVGGASDSEDEEDFDPFKHAKLITLEQFEQLSQSRARSASNSSSRGGKSRSRSRSRLGSGASSSGNLSAVKSWRAASTDAAWQDNRSQGTASASHSSVTRVTTEELIRDLSRSQTDLSSNSVSTTGTSTRGSSSWQ